MRKTIASHFRAFWKRDGYTLVEFGIVLVVVGLMLGAFAQSYALYNRTQAEQNTDENISAATASLSQYLVAFGSYPCPARLNALRSDPDYGVAGQCDATNAQPLSVTNPSGPYVAITAGNYLNGFFEQKSDRLQCALPPCPPGGWTTALIANPPTPANPFGPLVRRGMVPFRTLGLPESATLDGYNMRLQYAVTESLAVPGLYREQGGAIDVQDINSVTQATPANLPGATSLAPPIATKNGTTHYVMFSTGQDRAGGFTADGGQGIPCAAGTLDGTNCSTSVNAVYKVGPYTTTGGAAHDDDHLKYFSQVQSVLWRVSTPIGQNITDLINAGSGAGLIGIGGTPVAGGAALQVTGNVQARGSLVASQLCPPGTDSNCFPAGLTSTPCGAGAYANGIIQGQVQCVANIEADCPAGQVATGFANNKIQCAVNQGCGSKIITLCTPPSVATTDTRSLPGALSGTTWNNSGPNPGGNNGGVSGSSYWESWLCSGTTWTRQTQNGVCNCTAGAGVPTTQTCSSYYGQGNGTYSGNVTKTTTTVCPSGNTTQTTDTSQCACTPTTFPGTQTCPSGDTGGPLTTSASWTCPSGTAIGTGGTGHMGSATVTGGTPCSCNPAATKNQGPISCPTGYSGSYMQTATQICPAGTWSAWAPPSSPVPAACTCNNGAVQQNNLSCPVGQTGSGLIYTQTFSCATQSWSPAYPGTLFQNGCGTTTYTWKPVGTPTTGYSSPLGYSLYATCTTQGQTESCSTPDGTTYDHYNNNGCQCE